MRGHVCCSHVKGSLKNTLCDLDIDLICHGALSLAPALPFCSPVLKSQLDIFSFTCNILSDLGNSLIYLGRFKIEKTSNRDRPAAFCYWSAPWVKAHYEQKGRVRYKFSYRAEGSEKNKLNQKKGSWALLAAWGSVAKRRRKRARWDRRSRQHFMPSEPVQCYLPIKRASLKNTKHLLSNKWGFAVKF